MIKLSDNALQGLSKAGGQDRVARAAREQLQMREGFRQAFTLASAKLAIWLKTAEDEEKAFPYFLELRKQGVEEHQAYILLADMIEEILEPVVPTTE